jgi:osmotically-inducible protein OsmY
MPAVVQRPTQRLDIGAMAEARLRKSSYFALRNITCNFSDGRLILQGCVPSYYLKQLALRIVDSFEGVCEIINDIEVAAQAK